MAASLVELERVTTALLFDSSPRRFHRDVIDGGGGLHNFKHLENLRSLQEEWHFVQGVAPSPEEKLNWNRKFVSELISIVLDDQLRGNIHLTVLDTLDRLLSYMRTSDGCFPQDKTLVHNVAQNIVNTKVASPEYQEMMESKILNLMRVCVEYAPSNMVLWSFVKKTRLFLSRSSRPTVRAECELFLRTLCAGIFSSQKPFARACRLKILQLIEYVLTESAKTGPSQPASLGSAPTTAPSSSGKSDVVEPVPVNPVGSPSLETVDGTVTSEGPVVTPADTQTGGTPCPTRPPPQTAPADLGQSPLPSVFVAELQTHDAELTNRKSEEMKNTAILLLTDLVSGHKHVFNEETELLGFIRSNIITSLWVVAKTDSAASVSQTARAATQCLGTIVTVFPSEFPVQTEVLVNGLLLLRINDYVEAVCSRRPVGSMSKNALRASYIQEQAMATTAEQSLLTIAQMQRITGYSYFLDLFELFDCEVPCLDLAGRMWACLLGAAKPRLKLNVEVTVPTSEPAAGGSDAGGTEGQTIDPSGLVNQCLVAGSEVHDFPLNAAVKRSFLSMPKGRVRKNLIRVSSVNKLALETMYQLINGAVRLIQGDVRKSIQKDGESTLQLDQDETEVEGGLQSVLSVEDRRVSPITRNQGLAFSSDLTYLRHLVENRQLKVRLQLIATWFNQRNMKDVEAGLIDAGIMNSAEDLSGLVSFLRSTPNLDLELIGEILGDSSKRGDELRKEFFKSFTFTGLSLLAGIRLMLSTFKIPGEGQIIDRVMEAFAKEFFLQQPIVPNVPLTVEGASSDGPPLPAEERRPRYVNCEDTPSILTVPPSPAGDISPAAGSGSPNPGGTVGSQTTTTTTDTIIFPASDTVFILSFAILMLNTDLHHPDFKHRMPADTFVANARRIADLKCLSDSYLRGIYNSLAEHELQLQQQQGSGALLSALPAGAAQISPQLLRHTASISEPRPSLNLYANSDLGAPTELIANFLEILWHEGVFLEVVTSVLIHTRDHRCVDLTVQCLKLVLRVAHRFAHRSEDRIRQVFQVLMDILQPTLSFKSLMVLPVICKHAELLVRVEVTQFLQLLYLLDLTGICPLKPAFGLRETSDTTDNATKNLFAVKNETSTVVAYEPWEKLGSQKNSWLSDLTTFIFSGGGGAGSATEDDARMLSTEFLELLSSDSDSPEIRKPPGSNLSIRHRRAISVVKSSWRSFLRGRAPPSFDGEQQTLTPDAVFAFCQRRFFELFVSTESAETTFPHILKNAASESVDLIRLLGFLIVEETKPRVTVDSLHSEVTVHPELLRYAMRRDDAPLMFVKQSTDDWNRRFLDALQLHLLKVCLENDFGGHRNEDVDKILRSVLETIKAAKRRQPSSASQQDGPADSPARRKTAYLNNLFGLVIGLLLDRSRMPSDIVEPFLEQAFFHLASLGEEYFYPAVLAHQDILVELAPWPQHLADRYQDTVVSKGLAPPILVGIVLIIHRLSTLIVDGYVELVQPQAIQPTASQRRPAVNTPPPASIAHSTISQLSKLGTATLVALASSDTLVICLKQLLAFTGDPEPDYVDIDHSDLYEEARRPAHFTRFIVQAFIFTTWPLNGCFSHLIPNPDPKSFLVEEGPTQPAPPPPGLPDLGSGINDEVLTKLLLSKIYSQVERDNGDGLVVDPDSLWELWVPVGQYLAILAAFGTGKKRKIGLLYLPSHMSVMPGTSDSSIANLRKWFVAIEFLLIPQVSLNFVSLFRSPVYPLPLASKKMFHSLSDPTPLMLGSSLVRLLSDDCFEECSLPYSDIVTRGLLPGALKFFTMQLPKSILLTRKSQIVGDVKRLLLSRLDYFFLDLPHVQTEGGNSVHLMALVPLLIRTIRVFSHEMSVLEESKANPDALVEALKTILIVLGTAPELEKLTEQEVHHCMVKLLELPSTNFVYPAVKMRPEDEALQKRIRAIWGGSEQPPPPGEAATMDGQIDKIKGIVEELFPDLTGTQKNLFTPITYVLGISGRGYLLEAAAELLSSTSRTTTNTPSDPPTVAA